MKRRLRQGVMPALSSVVRRQVGPATAPVGSWRSHPAAATKLDVGIAQRTGTRRRGAAPLAAALEPLGEIRSDFPHAGRYPGVEMGVFPSQPRLPECGRHRERSRFELCIVVSG